MIPTKLNSIVNVPNFCFWGGLMVGYCFLAVYFCDFLSVSLPSYINSLKFKHPQPFLRPALRTIFQTCCHQHLNSWLWILTISWGSEVSTNGSTYISSKNCSHYLCYASKSFSDIIHSLHSYKCLCCCSNQSSTRNLLKYFWDIYKFHIYIYINPYSL